MTKMYSQAGQDLWALRCNNNAINGFYVDLGSHDGVNHSNSALLDYDYGWEGICVEANSAVAEVCRANRPNAVTVNACVGAADGWVHFNDQWVTEDTNAPLVPVRTLQGILDGYGARKTIDYLSLDIEGMEFETLEAFDFDAYRIHLMTIEHNLYAEGSHSKDQIFHLLSSRGFVRVVDNAMCLDHMYYGSQYEDWYASEEFYEGHPDVSILHTQ